MDEKYLKAIDQADVELRDSVSEKYGTSRALTADPTAYHRLVAEILPLEGGKLLNSASAVGIASLEFALPLVPFYGVQLVDICPDCITKTTGVERAIKLLEPLLAGGLLLPVLTAPLARYPEPLAALLSRYPRVPGKTRVLLPNAFLISKREPTDEVLCTYCSKEEECVKLTELREGLAAMRNATKNAAAVNKPLIWIEHTCLMLGPEVASAVGQSLTEAATNRSTEQFASVREMLASIEAFVFAAGTGARTALSAAGLASLQAARTEVGDQTEIADLQDEVANRLSVASQLGIAYDPSVDPAAYVEAVGPFAGSLTAAFGSEWVADSSTGGEALDAAISVANSINSSVARVQRADKALNAVSTTVSNPLVHTAVWAAIGAKVNVVLGVCGAGFDLGASIKAALGKPLPRAPLSRLPRPWHDAVESTFRLAPATLAVHGMQVRIGQTKRGQ